MMAFEFFSRKGRVQGEEIFDLKGAGLGSAEGRAQVLSVVKGTVLREDYGGPHQ